MRYHGDAALHGAAFPIGVDAHRYPVTIKDVGIRFEIIPNLPVDDGINAGRMFFDRLWVDEGACAFFLDAIAQYRREWDDSKGMFKETPASA